MKNINNNDVNITAELNLLHYLLNSFKHTKILIVFIFLYYMGILIHIEVGQNIEIGVLLDSEYNPSILMRRITSKL